MPARIATLLVHHGYPLDHPRPVPAVTTRIHVDASADRTRDPDEAVQAAKPASAVFRAASGCGQSGAGAPLRSGEWHQLIETLAEANHQRVKPAVRQEQIRAQSRGQTRVRHARGRRRGPPPHPRRPGVAVRSRARRFDTSNTAPGTPPREPRLGPASRSPAANAGSRALLTRRRIPSGTWRTPAGRARATPAASEPHAAGYAAR